MNKMKKVRKLLHNNQIKTFCKILREFIQTLTKAKDRTQFQYNNQ